MNVNSVKSQWLNGVRIFRGVRVSKGIYSIVLTMLHNIDLKHPGCTSVIDCEDLLAEMQTDCNRGKLTLSFGVNPVLVVYHSQPTLVQASLAQALLPGPSQAPPQPPQPQHPQPQPPSRKRKSQSDESPAEKRKREDTSPPRPALAPHTKRSCSSPLYSDVEPTTPPSFSYSPVAVRRPVKKRKKAMPGINPNNLLQCRLRKPEEKKQTAPYEEPLHPVWGINGDCANAVEVCKPSPPPQPTNMFMTSCTRCHCELTRVALNDAHRDRPAVCVLCGNYKAKRVSRLFLFIKLAIQCYSFCMFF